MSSPLPPGAAQLLTILVDETDMLGEQRLFEAIVHRLQELGVAGATVLSGIMGFGPHGRVHRRRLFGVSDERPVSICVVDRPDVIQRILPDIQAMVRKGLIYVQPVDVIC